MRSSSINCARSSSSSGAAARPRSSSSSSRCCSSCSLGSVYRGKYQGVPVEWAVLAGLVGYGCANTAFAGLAIQLVLRRESGILKRLRSTPLPPATYVAALLVSTLIVFALQTVALFLLGRALYGTPFPPDVGSLVVDASDRRGGVRGARHSDRVGRSARPRARPRSSTSSSCRWRSSAAVRADDGLSRRPPRDRRRAAAHVLRQARQRRLPARPRLLDAARGDRRARRLGRRRVSSSPSFNFRWEPRGR